jgi:hypothetical protein
VAAGLWWLGGLGGEVSVAIHPRVYVFRDALREAGARVFLLQAFDRDSPQIIGAKRTGRLGAIYVPLENDSDLLPPGQERYLRWLNDGPAPAAGRHAAKVCRFPADSVAYLNEPEPTNSDEEEEEEPPPPPPPPPPTDPWQNAFRWSLTGEADNRVSADPNRVVFSEATIFTATADGPGVGARPAIHQNFYVDTGDAAGRNEHMLTGTESKLFRENDESDIQFIVMFPNDGTFPIVSTNHYVQFFRILASVNGFPPIEFLVKNNASNQERVWLRHLGTDHDVALQSTLDVAGGYIWSEPLVRNIYHRFMLRVHWSDDPAEGWMELYKNEATVPVMARVYGKTLTDTSGTVRCYPAWGVRRHTAITGRTRVVLLNTQWEITRPP